MEVTLLSKTSNMAGTISFAAGVCYGKRDESLKRIENCYKAGHTGILEHGSVSFLVEGISRACSHQLVRHRMASYCQESQRYCNYSSIPTKSDDWYVIPESFKKNGYLELWFRMHMTKCLDEYKNAVCNGVKPEDARYMLPEAAKTAIVVTQNIRQLFHFFDLRLGHRAQWEVRELAEALHDAFKKEEPELCSIYDKMRESTRID